MGRSVDVRWSSGEFTQENWVSILYIGEFGASIKVRVSIGEARHPKKQPGPAEAEPGRLALKAGR
jgi:hypothetical protein